MTPALPFHRDGVEVGVLGGGRLGVLALPAGDGPGDGGLATVVVHLDLIIGQRLVQPGTDQSVVGTHRVLPAEG